MVEAGLGITVVPALTLFQFRSPRLVHRPIKSPEITRRIYIVRRRGHSLSVAAATMYELMKARKPQAPTSAIG